MKIATLESNQLESVMLQRIIFDAGHESIAFSTGRSLIDALLYKIFDLLILEWNLPDMRGVDVIRAIRHSTNKNMPVMFLTNQGMEVDVVRGMKAGANCYIAKPIRASELTARIQTLSKIVSLPILESCRVMKPRPVLLEVGFYYFDLIRNIASVHGHPVHLKPKEFNLAVLLFSHTGRLISREKIMNEIWGRELLMTSRTLDTHISVVRTKLQLNPDNNVRLVTLHANGYRLDTF